MLPNELLQAAVRLHRSFHDDDVRPDIDEKDEQYDEHDN